MQRVSTPPPVPTYLQSRSFSIPCHLRSSGDTPPRLLVQSRITCEFYLGRRSQRDQECRGKHSPVPTPLPWVPQHPVHLQFWFSPLGMPRPNRPRRLSCPPKRVPRVYLFRSQGVHCYTQSGCQIEHSS